MTDSQVSFVCRILERHPITSEPWKLEVIPNNQIIDLSQGNDFTILTGDKTQYYLTTLTDTQE